MDFKLLFNWFVSLGNVFYSVWVWLWTEIKILDYEIMPIELIGVGMITIGILRALA